MYIYIYRERERYRYRYRHYVPPRSVGCERGPAGLASHRVTRCLGDVDAVGCPAVCCTMLCFLMLPAFVKKTMSLLCEPLPCNPVPKTALQLLIWCSESLSSEGPSSLDELCFADTGMTWHVKA